MCVCVIHDTQSEQILLNQSQRMEKYKIIRTMQCPGLLVITLISLLTMHEFGHMIYDSKC